MEPAEISDHELLDFTRELQSKRLNPRICVFFIGLGDEEHGVWEHDLQVVPKCAHILRAGLEAVYEDEQMEMFLIRHTLRLW